MASQAYRREGLTAAKLPDVALEGMEVARIESARRRQAGQASREGQWLHRWWPGRCARWRQRGETEVIEDSADGAEIGDEGEEPARPAAGFAEQHVDEEHAAEQL